MEILEEKKESRWTTILLIIMNIILWGIIGLIAFFWNGVVHALTPVEGNIITNNQTYHYTPSNGGFIYNNEFFSNEDGLGGNYLYSKTGQILIWETTNINGYFQNPCNSNEDLTYSMNINFYKSQNDSLKLTNVGITNSITGCTGFMIELPDRYQYVNVCTLKAGDVPKYSLWFSNSQSGAINDRIGIETNFSVTCQVGNQAVIDNATANANNIINNVIQTTDKVIEETTNTINNGINNIINSQQVCLEKTTDTVKIAKEGYRLDINGNEVQSTLYFDLSDYIYITEENIYIVEKSNVAAALCYYDENKQLINCVAEDSLNQNTKYNTPSGTKYFRYSITKPPRKPIIKYNTCENGSQALINAEKGYFDSLNSAINQGLDAEHIHVDPDRQDFEDLEDVETSLHTYTNVNLNSFDVDLDTDTNSWVWNTLTSILNTHTLIFGMIISILSIGLIKLILNR